MFHNTEDMCRRCILDNAMAKIKDKSAVPHHINNTVHFAEKGITATQQHGRIKISLDRCHWLQFTGGPFKRDIGINADCIDSCFLDKFCVQRAGTTRETNDRCIRVT